MRTPRMISLGLIFLSLAVVSGLPVVAQSPDPGDVAAPTEFSGRIQTGPRVRTETTTISEGRRQSRNGAWAPPIVAMSDPRLDGDATISFDTDEYTTADGTTTGVGTGTWRVENADGAWQGSYHIFLADDYTATITLPMVGEGAYEGLVALWETTFDGNGWDVRGFILPNAPPAFPTAP